VATLSPLRAALHTPAAFFRRDFLIASSYKTAFAADTVGIVFKVITFYYIGAAVGGSVTPSLGSFSHNYFAFLLIGVALVDFVHTSLDTFASSIRESQLSGTLEVVLLSPIRLPQMVLYSSLWPYFFTLVRFVTYLTVAAVLFDLPIAIGGIGAALVALVATILCFAPLGIISASLIMLFKRGAWFQALVSGASFLLGGVAYPVSVLPPALAPISYYLPLTHSVNAIRQALLNGRGLTDPEMASDLLFLVAFAAITIPLALLVFELSVNRTRRLGTLTHY
jgi:ABC-2 type transport system permease protein